jgi:uncharacterized protein DUF3999
MKRLLLFMLTGIALGAQAAERIDDFAYAMPIAADPGEALYEVELPAALYRGVSRADLSDVRVFNAKGEMVPHAIRQRAIPQKSEAERRALPIFPLRTDKSGQLEDIQVRVHKRPDGTLVDIRSTQKVKPSATSSTHGYLLDASHNNRPMQALLFEWSEPRDGFVGKIHIEGSDDLSRWSTLVRDATLLDLEFSGHRLERKRVELRGQSAKYLRISWPGNQKALALTAVRAETAADVSAPQRVWSTLAGATPGKNPGEYEYDVGGPVPFDRLRIDLPHTNTLAQVRILARDKSSEEWRLLGERLVYRLQREGNDVTSPDIVMSGRGRFLMLRVDQKGGGIGSGQPMVQLGWLPQQLVFAARGEGPFQLAFGNHAAAATSFSIASIIPGHGTAKEFPVKRATLGEAKTISGEKKLHAPADYRRWALWTTLILGVAALGYMAFRLFRQMAADARMRDTAPPRPES